MKSFEWVKSTWMFIVRIKNESEVDWYKIRNWPLCTLDFLKNYFPLVKYEESKLLKKIAVND